MATPNTNRPVRIFLDMAEGPLTRVIKQTLPSIGDQPTHVYVDTAAEAELVIDSALVERAGGLEGLARVIAWAYDPPEPVPLNRYNWIGDILGNQMDLVWCARKYRDE